MNPDRVTDALVGEDPSLRRLYLEDAPFHHQIDNLARVLLPVLVRSLAAEARRDADERHAQEVALHLGEKTLREHGIEPRRG